MLAMGGLGLVGAPVGEQDEIMSFLERQKMRDARVGEQEGLMSFLETVEGWAL